MKQLIKNYTTEIPVERTIAEIQKLLADNGARGIALEYDERGTLKDIFFKIRLHEWCIRESCPRI
jgi:tRNA nucleotidyltransferase/poly(A) polymerase